MAVIAADGAGGAVIAWTDARTGSANADIYVQRVNATGAVLWTADGVLVGGAVLKQESPTIVGDGSGGAIVAWTDARVGPITIYAQRVNATGTTQWTANGVQLSAIRAGASFATTDGAGGAIIALNTQEIFPETDVYAQRINAAGTKQWTTDGVVVSVAVDFQLYIAIMDDGAGGAFLTWRDLGLNTVQAQHLNSSGVAQWVAGGVSMGNGGSSADTPALANDGAGGIIAAWSVPGGGGGNILASRVDASGTALWDFGNGVTVCNAMLSQDVPQIASDNLGGAIIAWQDGRTSINDIYAQRIDADGAAQWTNNGVPVCTAVLPQENPCIVSDGGNGVIMAWEDGRNSATTARDIYGLHLGSAGTVPTGVRNATPTLTSLAVDAYPNPFSATTRIEITSDRESPATIDVFDVSGHRVRSLNAELSGALTRTILFDGCDERGALLPSGVYFCRIQTRGETVTRKLVIER
jgi:hypothetical protein